MQEQTVKEVQQITAKMAAIPQNNASQNSGGTYDNA